MTPRGLARYFPSLLFYTRLLTGPFIWLCTKAARGKCDDVVWTYASTWFSEVLEDTGCSLVIEGLDNIAAQKEPCVFIANHMSTLETFLLPALIRPYMPLTFVVKESLVRLPFFGAVMRSRDPVVVNRKNPREDLSIVLKEGLLRLSKGISIIIFPQSTRAARFDPHEFNSIGEKLAKKANVAVIPTAIKTDAWPIGSLIKDIAPIHPDVPVHIRFGKPRRVEGRGKELHEEITSFIMHSLAEWS